MYIFQNKLFRFALMIVLWCAGFLPGLLVLKHDAFYGQYHLLFLFWGISLLLFMIAFTLLDSIKYILAILLLTTGVLGTIAGAICVYNAYNGHLTFAIRWVAQMITFSSLMLISYVIISKFTNTGHSIYQIICTGASYLVLIFNHTGGFHQVLIIIFMIAGYLGFLGLRNSY